MPHETLEKLKEGNHRFVENKLHSHNFVKTRRIETTVSGQDPFAAILTCSDARIPPNFIFDQGIGDLFIVRVAGNVCDSLVLAPLEFAVKHTNCALIVVLGHRHCGAVTSAVEETPTSPNIEDLLLRLRPAMDKVMRENKDMPHDELVNQIAKANAILTREKILRSSPTLKEAVENKKLEALAAYYNIETGVVEWL